MVRAERTERWTRSKSRIKRLMFTWIKLNKSAIVPAQIEMRQVAIGRGGQRIADRHAARVSDSIARHIQRLQRRVRSEGVGESDSARVANAIAREIERDEIGIQLRSREKTREKKGVK